MAPTRARYLDLIVASERTPEAAEQAQRDAGAVIAALLERAAAKLVAFVKAAWGAEAFSPDDVSAENEMSVVRSGALCGKRILLTADAGRGAYLRGC